MTARKRPTAPTTNHTAELEKTIASDPVLSLDEHAGEVYLARTLAAELDRQTAANDIQTRTIATYAGVLGALRRVIRDEQERRRKDSAATAKPAGRLALIQAAAAATGKGTAQ